MNIFRSSAVNVTFSLPVIFFLLFSVIIVKAVANENEGTEWHWSNPTYTPININDVVWNGNQFVAVGTDGGVRVGATSQNWLDYKTPTQYPLSGVAWNGRKYVAVGGINLPTKLEHVILNSLDGKNWNIVKNDPSNPLNAVASDGSQFIAVGLFAVMKSTDGEAWTMQSPNSTVFKDIIWTGTQFVLVGERGTIMSSPNGDNWTDYSITTNDTFNSIVWNGSTFVVVGTGGSIYTGADLTSLNSQVYKANHTAVMWSDVINKFILATGAVISTSNDGVTWAEEQALIPAFNTLSENASTIVGLGNDGDIYTSDNANFWSPPIRKRIEESNFKSIIWGNNQYVAVGKGGVTGTQIWTSRDAINWKSFNNGGQFNVPIVDIAFNGNLFVTVSGRKNDVATTFTSTDLVTWEKNKAGFSVRGMNGITWADTQFIGAGNNNNISTSPDGKTWARLNLSSANVENTDFNNIYYDGEALIALGREFVNPIWVGTILTSTDWGESWVKQTSNTDIGLNDIAKNDTVYVAVGGDGAGQVILTSPDLVNWTKRDSGFSGNLRSIIWDGKQFVAPIAEVVISNNRKNLTGGVLTSVDGETWAFESIPGTSALTSVVEESGQTILVGSRSNILRKGNRAVSDDVLNDNEAPNVIPPDNITIDAGEGLDATIIRITHPDIISFLGNAQARDNVVIVGAISNDAPSEFISSTTTKVTFTAVDAAGNQGTASATVTILNGKDNQGAIGVPDGAPKGSGGLPVEVGGGGAINISLLFLMSVMLLFRNRRLF